LEHVLLRRRQLLVRLGRGHELLGVGGEDALTRALFPGSPGTMASICTASSRRSSRSPALRAALSGAWQAEQVSARMGRMSRLYFSRSSARADIPQQATTARTRMRSQGLFIRLRLMATPTRVTDGRGRQGYRARPCTRWQRIGISYSAEMTSGK